MRNVKSNKIQWIKKGSTYIFNYFAPEFHYFTDMD